MRLRLGSLASMVVIAAGCGPSVTTRDVPSGRRATPVQQVPSVPPANASCARVVTTSTLPGVRFDLSGNRCRYSRAEVAAGVSLVYRTVVDAPIAGVQQERSGIRCDPTDPSGLAVAREVGGSGQGFCWCDCGMGQPGTRTFDLAPGSYPSALLWDGTNWRGPSDTNNPHGPAFPPGTYTFSLRATGMAPSAASPFAIEGTLTFELVP